MSWWRSLCSLSVQLLKSSDLGRHSLLYLKEIGYGWFGKVRDVVVFNFFSFFYFYCSENPCLNPLTLSCFVSAASVPTVLHVLWCSLYSVWNASVMRWWWSHSSEANFWHLCQGVDSMGARMKFTVTVDSFTKQQHMLRSTSRSAVTCASPPSLTGPPGWGQRRSQHHPGRGEGAEGQCQCPGSDAVLGGGPTVPVS